MISNTTKTKTEEIEELLEQESAVVEEIRQKAYRSNSIVQELRAISQTDGYALMQEELNKEYQRLFKGAMGEEDAIKSKTMLERMKSIGFAMNVLPTLIASYEDEAVTLESELSKLQGE